MSIDGFECTFLSAPTRKPSSFFIVRRRTSRGRGYRWSGLSEFLFALDSISSDPRSARKSSSGTQVALYRLRRHRRRPRTGSCLSSRCLCKYSLTADSQTKAHVLFLQGVNMGTTSWTFSRCAALTALSQAPDSCVPSKGPSVASTPYHDNLISIKPQPNPRRHQSENSLLHRTRHRTHLPHAAQHCPRVQEQSLHGGRAD